MRNNPTHHTAITWQIVYLAGCFAACLGACISQSPSDTEPAFVDSGECNHTDSVQAAGVPKVDVLWVIDNSESMCEVQADLAENLDVFAEHLVQVGVDFQLAVITTDMEDPSQSGRFQNRPNVAPGDEETCNAPVDISQCPTPENGQEYPPLIIRSTDPRYLNEDRDPDIEKIQRDFRCNAAVGTGGTEFEMGLEAARRALSPALTQGFNAGFLREDAFLAVIFVSDENDCSNDGAIDFTSEDDDICEWDRDELTPVQEYVDFFSSLKYDINGDPDPSQIIMVAIVGPSDGVNTDRPDPVEPSCTVVDDAGNVTFRGFAGYRYKELLDAFDNDYEDNVCAPPFNSIRGAINCFNCGAVVPERCLQAPPPTCVDDADCDGECVERGNQTLCDTFRIQVEIERPIIELLPRGFDLVPGDDPEPGQCAELTVQGLYRCVLTEGEHYEIDYADSCKPTGIEVELLKPLGSYDRLIVSHPTPCQTP